MGIDADMFNSPEWMRWSLQHQGQRFYIIVL